MDPFATNPRKLDPEEQQFYAARRQRQQEEDRKLRETRLAVLEAEKRQRQETLRQRAEDELREQLRATFLSNPAATEEDFKRAYPHLRERALIEDASTQLDRDKLGQLAHLSTTYSM